MTILVDITAPPYSAVCNGNVTNVVATISTKSPTAVDLTSTTPLWASDDEGEAIIIGAADGGNEFPTTIATFVSSTHVRVSNSIPSTLTNSSQILIWGTDDSAAFMAFNAWAVGQTDQIQLTIPSGKHAQFLSGNKGWVEGIKDLIVIGSGASISNGGALNPGFHLGGCGGIVTFPAGATVALLTSDAALGASSVRINPSDASKFTVGNYALVSGFDMQGLFGATNFGYPPNWQFFDYVKVDSIDAVAGIVHFTTSLKYKYLTTWPNYDLCQFGQAALWQLPAGFDCTLEYRGLTISQDNIQTYSNARSVTYRDVTFTGLYGGIPSQNVLWQAINVNYPTVPGSQIEADKLVTKLVMQNCTFKKIDFQSSSIDELQMDGCTSTEAMNGNPKRTTVSNSTFPTLRIGTEFYGHAEDIMLSNCVINASEISSPVITGNGTGVNSAWTMVDDAIVIPNTFNAQPWAVPGTNLFWSAAIQASAHFTVLSVTQDLTNTYVKTSWRGGFPSGDYLSGGNIGILVHPCPSWTALNCSGTDPQIAGMKNALPGKPIFSYWQQTYDESLIGSADQPHPRLWGKVASVEFNVTQADASGGARTFHLSSGDNWPALVNGVATNYGPFVNAKVLSDTVLTPSDLWLGGQSNSGPGFSFTGTASVTLTIQADQGITSRSLRLQLH